MFINVSVLIPSRIGLLLYEIRALWYMLRLLIMSKTIVSVFNFFFIILILCDIVTWESYKSKVYEEFLSYATVGLFDEFIDAIRLI